MERPNTTKVIWASDPRYFQIGALSVLLCWGILGLEFQVSPAQCVVTIGAAILSQFCFSKWYGLPTFDSKSALISSLSLCLLLRTNSLGLAGLTAVLAVGSKFLLRVRGKHVFNPTDGALCAMALLSNAVWVSPGQWGSAAFFAFAILCLGILVVTRAQRADITLAFLVFFAAVQLGRAAYLGDPFEIPLHRLQSGALLLFSFFMISDPKTTPDSRTGRILFALLVALLAGFIQLKLFRNNGPLWALFILSPLVPVIDRLLPGRSYQWNDPAPRPGKRKGDSHATLPHIGGGLPRPALG